ncbi:MAG: tetratricopeptide repeat protein [Phycisphaerae bacterium]|jgi:hypothetical protein
MKQEQNKLYISLIYAVLAVSTFIAYEPVRHNGFLNYDDDRYVTENPYVNGGISFESIKWAFTTGHASNWHPLTWMSHMLDCSLFGLNPAGHHIINLIFHIANTLLLFWVLQRMTGAVWQSAFVAAAFALHPLHVESVAWVAERKDVLSTLFWILTMAAYLSYVRRPSAGRYLLTLLAFALGLMAKPMLVTLPFVLLLLDYWPLDRLQDSRNNEVIRWPNIYHLIWEKVPFFALSAVSSAATFIAQRGGGAVVQMGYLPPGFRIANASASYVNYVNKMLYPVSLSVLYPYHSTELSQVITNFIELAAVSAFIIYMSRRYRYLAVGWFWYLGTLVPVIGLVQVGSQAMNDRYTYVPSIGIFIIAAWGAAELLAKWRYRKIGLAITAGIVLTMLLVCTRIQSRYWQNSLTLFGHAAAVNEKDPLVHLAYGKTLLKNDRIEDAVTHFNETLRLMPASFEAYNGLGMVFIKQGKNDDAIACFAKSLSIKPNQPVIHYSSGVAYLAVDKYDEAIRNFKDALRLKPDFREASQQMAMALKEKAKTNESVRKKEKPPR